MQLFTKVIEYLEIAYPMDYTSAQTLNDLFHEAWALIKRGQADKMHPFHWPVFGTYNDDLGVQLRTVILRKSNFEEGILRCYSDKRTIKVNDLQKNNRGSWLFYHPSKKVQIRASGFTSIHIQDEIAIKIWPDISPKGRKDYIGPFPPGSHHSTYTSNIPENIQNESLSTKNTDFGIQNFTVIETVVNFLDLLYIRKEGHLRAHFIRKNTEWEMIWAAP